MLWPVKKDGVWGFYLPPAPEFVPREAAVAYALTHLDPALRDVFYWWDLFLDRLLTLPLLPRLAEAEGGLVPVWSLVGLEEWAEETYGREDLDQARHVVAFFNDWADDFVRQHAPDLEARRALGGPLGRRLVARLVRPRAPWDVNEGERRVLLAAMDHWAEEARTHAQRRMRGSPAIRLMPREGGALTIRVESGNPEDVAEWAGQWPLWSRVQGDPAVPSLELNPAEADRFWREELPRLIEAGVKLLLPETPWNPTLTLRGRVKGAQGRSSRIMSLDQIIEVQWEVLLGGQSVPLEEVRRLVQQAAPLVRIGGEFVALDDKMRRTLEEAVATSAKRRIRLAEALRWAVEGSRGSIEFLSSGAVLEILQQLNAPLPRYENPPGFQGVLRPYQQEGVSWLVRRMRSRVGALLADDMGLGKTIEVIAALAVLAEEQPWPGPVLVVAPLSVVNNWEREFQRFTPWFAVASHLGPHRLQDEALMGWVSQYHVILTTYDVLVRDSEWLQRIAWQGLVADEAQHVKNPNTKRARALRRLSAQWRVALTGTPVENRLHDLWAEMEFLNPGYLGSEREFRQRFESGAGGIETGRLKQLLAPFVLRRVKTDPVVMPDLPDKVETYEWTHLTPEQVALYQAIVDRLFREVTAPMTRMARRGAIVAALTHLKQVTDHPLLYLHQGGSLRGRSGKLERLEELLEAIFDANERVVVFTQYVAWIHLLAPYLRRLFQVPVLTLHGSLSKRERDEIIETFNHGAGPAALLASLKAGGVGLNLARAQHVIHYDRWWNPATEDQATDRVWRMGQTALVTVHKFVTRGTVEERIDVLINQKRQLSRDVLSNRPEEQWVSELSNQELRELIELRDGVAAPP
ncbi:MAG: DEAD/DEAH box helicase [Firmicutes bacterium]|nr:DEAD/DEAH box helicase [Bacillota bacterium]